jgi:3-methyladenine DNA glycosylase AlkD
MLLQLKLMRSSSGIRSEYLRFIIFIYIVMSGYRIYNYFIIHFSFKNCDKSLSRREYFIKQGINEFLHV